MVLGKLTVSVRLIRIVTQGPAVLAVGAGGLLDIFSPSIMALRPDID